MPRRRRGLPPNSAAGREPRLRSLWSAPKPTHEASGGWQLRAVPLSPCLSTRHSRGPPAVATGPGAGSLTTRRDVRMS